MQALPERLTDQRSIPGPPCAMGLLLANVTDEDRASILEGIEMIREARATRPAESKLPPNAAWLHRLLRSTIGVNIAQGTIQRHMNDMCRCSRESR
jgi:hypothetical protein